MLDNKKLILNPTMRIGLFLCITILCFIFCALISGIIMYKWEGNIAAMRIATIMQDLILFISPALITSILVTRLPADFLQLRKLPSFSSIFLTALIVLLSIPAMNFIVHCNESIVLPESLNSLEVYFKSLENSSQESINLLLGFDSAASFSNLIMSILIVGILTGISEELFFRGALQNLLLSNPMKAHIAIWTTAIIFSAMHFQFYGFIPRVLLGAFFGYLAFWSGSLWLPIFAHALNNSLVVLSTWLVKRNAINIDINKIGTEYTSDNLIFIAISVIATTLGIVILYRHYKQKLAQ